ncbi:hypothetical protein BS47DRAFT_1302934 [Hydnum rufescens UP504]|uniref:Uncharacterized protein n=1 Tax=Hydnum rufescens UP504 TaxID=1448309 RepID=A0A9P6AM55_9AGAM|nr:hypothetical protein BS47DRAFT_1302934 [Hydnum rufescens UP504]
MAKLSKLHTRPIQQVTSEGYLKSIKGWPSSAALHLWSLNAYHMASSYKMSLRRVITLANLESLDTDLSRDTTWILENNITNLIFKTVIEYHILHWVYKPFDTSMSGFSKLIPQKHSNILDRHLLRNCYL